MAADCTIHSAQHRRGQRETKSQYSYHSKRSIEYEYEYEYRDAEYEYEKTHEQSIGPKCSIGAL